MSGLPESFAAIEGVEPARLELDGVSKSYGETTVLDRVSLTVARGEFVALVGPSGCGKSTLLKMVAGLEFPDAGHVRIAGTDVTDVRAADRDVAMVLQSYALYPHLTARQNLALPLVMRRLTGRQRLPFVGRFLPGTRAQLAAIGADVEKAGRALKIDHLLDRKPAAMSGGQRQRVALGRAMVRDPRLFLMDEPLSNLDASLRVHTRAEIVDLHKALGATTVYVTHDQEEALGMADRVAILHRGRLLQVASPEIVYRDPSRIEVASFIGSPSIGLIEAVIDDRGRAIVFDRPIAEGFAAQAGATVRVGIRPEHLRIGGHDDAILPARLDRTEFLGADALAHLRLPDGAPIVAKATPEIYRGFVPGPVGLAWNAADLLVFDAAGDRLRPRFDAATVTAERAHV
ncbi:ABC transporter ATP-binding protein [Siculibacillus lacustris]|uniref:ABC transporter ATP-binding protein n=1 Tax=Siculibacillus lacustris TaxID=1549641 RepID=A0A4Q9VPX6_9HYPH|nr:ABC transporter ATP-binding protein [Siculibacillus lacustris]TBW36991.1 ABC transporter ATP-binding protein [Siculibacillus lacustris]